MRRPAVDGEGLDRRLRGEALGRDDLEGVAGVDVLDDPRDRPLELLPAHVGLEGDVGGLRGSLRRRHRLAEPFAQASPIASTARAYASSIPPSSTNALAIRVTSWRWWSNATSSVGDHQRHVGQADRIGIRLASWLDRADQVVAEEPDRPAGERRQLVGLGDLDSGPGSRPRPRRGPAHRSLGRARLRSRTQPPLAAPLGEHPVAPAQDRRAGGSPGRTSGRADPARPTRAGRRDRRRAA